MSQVVDNNTHNNQSQQKSALSSQYNQFEKFEDVPKHQNSAYQENVDFQCQRQLSQENVYYQIKSEPVSSFQDIVFSNQSLHDQDYEVQSYERQTGNQLFKISKNERELSIKNSVGHNSDDDVFKSNSNFHKDEDFQINYNVQDWEPKSEQQEIGAEIKIANYHLGDGTQGDREGAALGLGSKYQQQRSKPSEELQATKQPPIKLDQLIQRQENVEEKLGQSINQQSNQQRGSESQIEEPLVLIENNQNEHIELFEGHDQNEEIIAQTEKDKTNQEEHKSEVNLGGGPQQAEQNNISSIKVQEIKVQGQTQMVDPLAVGKPIQVRTEESLMQVVQIKVEKTQKKKQKQEEIEIEVEVGVEIGTQRREQKQEIGFSQSNKYLQIQGSKKDGQKKIIQIETISIQKQKLKQIQRQRVQVRQQKIEQIKVLLIGQAQQKKKSSVEQLEKEEKKQQDKSAMIFLDQRGIDKINEGQNQKKDVLTQNNFTDKADLQEKIQSEKKEKKQKKQKKSKRAMENKDDNSNKKYQNPDDGQNKKKDQKQKLKSNNSIPSKVDDKKELVSPITSNIVNNAVASKVQQIQPNLIIREAQKQRIQSTYNQFSVFVQKHKQHVTNLKSVFESIIQEIARRKQKKIVWYTLIKQYLKQNQEISKAFHETSYKIPKQEKNISHNKFLNISQELKQGVDQLIFLRKETGNDYNRFNQYINVKLFPELQLVFSKYNSELNRTLLQAAEKKSKFSQSQQQFKKFISKLLKILQKGKEGKNIDEDVFVQTCKFIQLERQFKANMITWGKSIIQLRKVYITIELRLNEQFQNILNVLKNSSAAVYSFHAPKFQKMIDSREQVHRESTYSKLCTLADSDFIKYSLELLKVPTNQINQKLFQQFIQLEHLQIITGKSSLLLKGMMNKQFQLKDKEEQLVNTISGNLVQYNTLTQQYINKFVIKNLQASIIDQSMIQFDEIIPGFIFKNQRSVRLSFKDRDRAQQLICLLNL